MGKAKSKQGGGFGLRLAFAIILAVVAFPCIVLSTGVSGGGAIRQIIMICALYLTAATILQFVAAFVGKKSRGANTLSIVVGALCIWLLFLGVMAIVGGVRGRRAFANSQPASTQPEELTKSSEPAVEMSSPAAVANEQAVEVSADVESAAIEGDSASQTIEKQQIKRSDFKLDLYDANIDERTWKDFKRTASQEELAVIAIGAKYRIAHSRIINIIYAIGIVLSIAIFWPTGGWSLLGYPVFAFLATKSIRYQDTYSQSYRKLSKENRAFVDGYFNNNIGLTILDVIINIATFWLTLPYQAILLFIGLFAPNFVISKNGILVSIPKGYDVGGLGAVGAYYESISFIDEALASNKKAASSGAGGSSADSYYAKTEYTYTDSHGYEQTVYSSDGKDFYDAGGNFVGSSGDGGTFKKND